MKVLDITQDQAQELRTKGYWIVSDRAYNKIYLITKVENECLDFFDKYKDYYKQRSKKLTYWGALRKIVITQDDINRADKMYALGLNCPMSELYI